MYFVSLFNLYFQEFSVITAIFVFVYPAGCFTLRRICSYLFIVMNERSRKMLLLARGSGSKEKSEPITCNRSNSKNNSAAKVSSISVLKPENSSNARDCCMPILKLGTDMSVKDKSIPVFESENATSANDNFISVLESENSTGANENPMPKSNSSLPVDKPENNNNIIGIHKSVSESESFDNNQEADNISNDFVVKECVGCKMSLRRVVRKPRQEDNDSPTHDFSSGSEDEYRPSTDSDSCDSHVSESEPVERLTGEVLENQDNVCLSAVNKRGKKRAAVPQNWKKEKAKRQRNSGLSYKSATGKIVEARKIGPPCSDKCRLSCSNKVAQDDRVQLFKDFWKLGELQRQRDYLTSCVDQVVPQYRRISAKKPRAPNCAFYVNLIGKKVRVCKTFLINTFGVTERAIRTVITSKMSGSGIAAKDDRGKHSHHKKVDEALVQSVRDHIDSIPRIDSHYLRQHTSRQFIDGGLTIAEMHRHYQKKRSEQNEAAVSYDLYSRIFNKEFNIGFFIPKKDQCDLCEGYKNANAAGKASLEISYQQHLAEKDLSRVEKANDKEKATKKEIGLAVYDLQAVMPVPMGQSSAFFYKSKLNCYNFTVSIATIRDKDKYKNSIITIISFIIFFDYQLDRSQKSEGNLSVIFGMKLLVAGVPQRLVPVFCFTSSNFLSITREWI